MAKRLQPKKAGRVAAQSVNSDPLAAVRFAYEKIVSGCNEFELLESFTTQFPDADKNIVLPEVMELFKRASDFDSDVLIGWCLESARDLYRRMVLANDFNGAIKAVKLIADFAACKS